MNGTITVELGGQLRPIRFGMLAYETLLASVQKDDGKVKSTARVIYAGILNAHEVNGTLVDITFQDVYGWVDDLLCTKEGNNTIELIEQCFEQSNMYQNILKPQIEKKSAKSKIRKS